MRANSESAPRVSVIMSAHNTQDYIRLAVESVLSQEYRNFEMIVVDDGSTDGTSHILQELACDTRVRLIRQDPAGLTTSLNTAASFAQGEYIARQDADDVSLPKRFALQVEFLDATPHVALVGTASDVINENGYRIGQITPPVKHEEIVAMLRTSNCITHGSVMFRRAAFESVGGYDIRFPMAQDYDLWLRLSEVYHLANLAKALYQYRVWPGSISIRSAGLQEDYRELARQLARTRQHANRLPQSG